MAKNAFGEEKLDSVTPSSTAGDPPLAPAAGDNEPWL